MPAEQLTIKVGQKGALVAARNIDDIGRSAKRASGAATLLKRSLGGLAGAALVRQLMNVADSFTTIQNRLNIVTESTGELNLVTDRLFEIANKTRSSFEATAIVYSRAALSAGQLGVNQRQLLDFTEYLNKAVILSGASFREANQGLIQLSQGLASGTLRGDELRSVLEQLPAVADVIAKGLGVTRGQLRKLGEEGKITGRDIVRAFQEQREEIEKKYGKTIPTISQAFGILQNSIVQVVGRLSKSTGAASSFSEAVIDIANDVADATPKIEVFVGAVGDFLRQLRTLPNTLKFGLAEALNLDEVIVNFHTVAGAILLTIDQIISRTKGYSALLVLGFKEGLKNIARFFADTFNSISKALRDFVNDSIRLLNELRVPLGLDPLGFVLSYPRIDTKPLEKDVATAMEIMAQLEATPLLDAFEKFLESSMDNATKRAIDNLKNEKLLDRVPGDTGTFVDPGKDVYGKFIKDLQTENHLLQLSNAKRERQKILIDFVKAAEKEGQSVTLIQLQELDALAKKNQALERQAALLHMLRGPQEEFSQGVQDLKTLLDNGDISLKEFRKGVEELKATFQKDQKKTLTGLQEALTTPFIAGRAALDEFAREGTLKIKTFVQTLLAELGKVALQRIFLSLGTGGAGLPGFRNQGSFTVGGTGGPDSQTVAFNATPGEPVAVGDRAIAEAAGKTPVVPQRPIVNIYNVLDPSIVPQGLDSAEGEQTIVNIITRQRATIQQVLAS